MCSKVVDSPACTSESTASTPPSQENETAKRTKPTITSDVENRAIANNGPIDET